MLRRYITLPIPNSFVYSLALILGIITQRLVISEAIIFSIAFTVAIFLALLSSWKRYAKLAIFSLLIFFCGSIRYNFYMTHHSQLLSHLEFKRFTIEGYVTAKTERVLHQQQSATISILAIEGNPSITEACESNITVYFKEPLSMNVGDTILLRDILLLPP
ncbi:MAG TPA: hypothetical protein VHA52_02945, partial [Candidatus Babeliaceae bacterium]|nr:hypothetical protein [Candidatus Babeliaceae bacterium]